MPPPLDHWLSRSDFTLSDYLSSDMMNNLANDIRYWGGNVNGGGYILSNVILEGSGGFQFTASPITLTQGGDGETRLELRQGTGADSLLRWALVKDAIAETGANAGSNFNLKRYNDAGAFLGTPFAINRATGVITMGAQHWTGPIDGGGQTITNIVIPGVSGQVSSVFTRIGAVVAAAGDYTAAQVTNAVSTQGSYADPGWITSLAWGKITGAPAPAVSSVFTRTGAVSAASGDYTAAQVTNAVSTQGSYADPIWLTSLAWAKITGAPVVSSAIYYVNGTFVASRPTLNLIAGTGTILSGSVDQLGPNRVDITVTATGAGGGLPQSPWASDINAAGFTLRGAGRIGAGITPPDSRLMLSNNAAAPPVPTAGTIAHLAGADADNTRILMDSFGGASNLTLRSSGGTAAALTALASGAVLGTLAFQGYGATSYSATARASILATAAENWSDTAQGTLMGFYTTPAGSTTPAERMRIAADGKVGIGMTPAWPLDVTGDCNITGTYRVNGVPLSTGGGGSQTPWTSDIVAAGNALHRVKGIGIGATNNAQDGFGILVDSLTVYDGFKQLNSSPNGWAGFSLQNDAGITLSFRVYGSTRATPNLAKLESSGAFTFDTAANERMRITTGELVGIGKTPSTYRLEVAGDIDITGTYRVNGLPLSTGGNQTPWTSDIDGALWKLNRVAGIGVNSNAVTNMGVYVDSNSITEGLYQVNRNTTGYASISLANNSSGIMSFRVYGTAGAFPNECRVEATGPLVLSVNAAERMRITSAGLVGLGTTLPQSVLHCYRKNVGAVAAITIDNDDTQTGVGQAIKFNYGATGTLGGIYHSTNGDWYLRFKVWSNVSEVERLTINGTNGNVGIGTTNPIAPLSVRYLSDPTAVSGASQIAICEQGDRTTYRVRMGFFWNSPIGRWTGLLQSTDAGTGGPLLLNPEGGSVGIGLTNPGAVLDVNAAGGVAVPLLRLQHDNAYRFDIDRNYTTGSLSIQGSQAGYNNILLCPTSGYVGIGTATPVDPLTINGIGNGGQLRLIYSQYGVFFRNDNVGFYCMVTNVNDPYGTWNGTFPWSFDLASKAMSIYKLTVSTRITASAGITVAASGIDCTGQLLISSDIVSGNYASGALQIRETNRNSGGATDVTYAPRIGFHWAGRVASQIGMDSSGEIRTYDNPGTSYERFHCAGLTASSYNGYLPPGQAQGAASSVLNTDGAGYLWAGWINTVSGDNGGAAIARVYASHDGFIRYYTLANFAAQIAPYVPSGGVSTQTTPGAGPRVMGSIYRNTTGKAMCITISLNTNSAYAQCTVQTDANATPTTTVAHGFHNGYMVLTFWVLPNNYYRANQVSGSISILYWTEWY